jgi:hypothetical protein
MRHWTQEERQRQSQIIKKWQPWEHSTGAKTVDGKERSKMNALKSGAYSQRTKELYQLIKQTSKRADDLLQAL